MKRIAFIISLVLVIACDKNNNGPVGTTDEGCLEVSFVYEGSEVADIELSPQMQTIEIEVGMSHEAIGWKVSSDQEWCVVDNAQTHTGSSKFSVSVPANMELSDRSTATITLKAGYYKKYFQVRQRGKVVVIDKVYSVCNSSSGSLDLDVRCREGVEWRMDTPQWLRATVKNTQSCEDGMLASVSLEWDANLSESRYGTVGFINGQDDLPSEYFSLCQLGAECGSTDNGGVRILDKDAEALEIKMPAGIFNDIEDCDWISVSDKHLNDDGTETWKLEFKDNPSDKPDDMGKSRSKALKLLSIYDSAEVALPEFYQDYYPAGGLMTLQGLECFAQHYRENRDLSLWMNEDKVLLLNDLDLANLGNWSSIGTDEKPFGMHWDGCGNKISGFHSSSSLLGVCENAVISNLIFDETCELSLESSFDRDCYLAPLAEKVSNTVLNNCESNAQVRLAGSAIPDGLKVFVGGLVASGQGDISMNDCDSKSRVIIQYIPKSDESFISAGGILGYVDTDSELAIQDSDWDGNIIYDVSESDVVGTVSVGGILGLTDVGANLNINNATSKGQIEIKADSGKHWKGTSSFGGVVGAVLTGGTIKSCVNDCEIKWASKTARSNGHMFAVGGIAGRIGHGIALISDCTNKASLSNLHWNNNGWNDRFTAHKTGGIIGCYGDSEQLDKQTSNIKIEKCCNTSKVYTERGFAGGIAGYLINAEVSECSFTGNCKAERNANPYVGGIVGGAQYSQINDSIAEADLSSFSGGSCDSRAGGIVGLLYSGSEVNNCSYSGSIETGDNGEKEVYFGGIAADTEKTCKIVGCGFNGSILSVEITEDNFEDYVTGDHEAVVEKNYYLEVVK